MNQQLIASQWESALLNKVTSNGERIALVENSLTSVENRLSSIETNIGIVKEAVLNNDSRLTDAEEIISLLNRIIKITRWILAISGASLFSIIANIIYQNLLT